MRLPAHQPDPRENHDLENDNYGLNRITCARLNQCGVAPERQKEGDLSGLNLAGVEISGVDLRGFLLSKANFEKANLRGADLRCVHFAGVQCVSAVFCGADLRGANLSFGYFNNADFSGSDLRGAILTDAQCSDCCFSGADLRGAALGADLVGSDFRGADLRGVMLSGDCKLEQLGCDLRGALLTPPKKGPEANRRRALRVQLAQPLRIFERKMMQQIGVVVDISKQGLRLAGPRAVPVDAQLEVRLELPQILNIGATLDIDLRSVWCRFNEGEGKFLAGFNILRIATGGNEILQSLMDKFNGKQTEFFG